MYWAHHEEETSADRLRGTPTATALSVTKKLREDERASSGFNKCLFTQVRGGLVSQMIFGSATTSFRLFDLHGGIRRDIV